MDPRYRTARWKALRRQVIARDGPHCTRPGCTTDMTLPKMICVDHIIDVKDGGPFWDPHNLQVLCRWHNIGKGFDNKGGRGEPVSPNR